MRKDLLKPGKFLLEYIRDKNKQPRGIVVAYRDNENQVQVGWSLCNIKVDKFNKEIGLAKAIESGLPIWFFESPTANTGVASSVKDNVNKMVKRAVKYFRPQKGS